MAQVFEAQHQDGKKRKLGDTAAGQDESGGQSSVTTSDDDGGQIFMYLTPSDLRLTPEALISTKQSHFHCNVNGCARDYRSHTALARHRKEKHGDWAKHTSHAANEDCRLTQPAVVEMCLAVLPASDCPGRPLACRGRVAWGATPECPCTHIHPRTPACTYAHAHGYTQIAGRL
jgi:hypothetical protein